MPGRPVIFSLTMLLLLLVALLTIQVDELRRRARGAAGAAKRRTFVGWVAGGAGDRRAPGDAGRARTPRSTGSLRLLAAFFAFVTWSELRTLLRQRQITGETISMSMAVYLLIGMTWGLLYIMIPSISRRPSTSERLPAVRRTWRRRAAVFPIFIYFSLTTLSTIGFGDITPLTLQARYAAVAEGITGQFYLAILVARLVGLQMNQSPAPAVADQLRAPETEPSFDRGR